MWRKRTLRGMIFIATLFAIIASTSVLAYAANGCSYDSMKDNITKHINELVSLIEENDEYVEEATQPVTETVIETVPETTEALEIVFTPLVYRQTSENPPEPEFLSNFTSEVPVLVQTVPEDDDMAINIKEILIDGTQVYEFKGMDFTIPYNPIEREPMVSESGYVEQYTEVPLYIQQSYPYTKYGGHGTVSSHGCGITSCAMVYTYLLDKPIMPDELAEVYGKYNTSCGSSYTLFSQSAEDLGLEVEMVYNWQDVEEALKNGCVVIANVRSDSIFTTGGHYIVYRGITDDGRILVNDPNIYNYGKWSSNALKEGFKNGFDQKYCKYSFPCWIYSLKDIENVSEAQ